MDLINHKCLLCGTSADLNANYTISRESRKIQGDILNTWKNECVTATCDILFGDKINHFIPYFENAQYCSLCEQLVRDIGFTWKQLKRFQNEIQRLTVKILKILDLHFRQVEKKCERSVVEKRASLFVSSTMKETVPNYSQEELVGIIYTVAKNTHNFQEDTETVHPLKSYNLEEQVISETFLKHQTVLSTSFEGSNVKIEEYDCDDNFEDEWTDSLHQEEEAADIVSDIKSESRIDHYDEIASNGSSPPIESKFDVISKNAERIAKRRTEEISNISRTMYSTYGVPCTEDDCDMYFKTKESMTRHRSEMHKGDPESLSCTQCQIRFTRKYDLRRHIANGHKRRPPKYISCSFCGKCMIKDDLTLHYSNSHQEPNPFQCAFCSQIFMNREDLTNHTTESHEDLENLPKFKCNMCPERFLTSKHLSRHRLKKHEDQINFAFNCSTCDKKFALKRGFDEHMETHDESKLKCDVCSKKFPTTAILRKHLKEVHKKAAYECRICKLMLPNNSARKTHERSHRNTNTINFTEFVHKCSYCAKGYKTEEDLNGHYAEAHQGPNPFCCAFCPQVYSNSLDLQSHMKLIHPEPEETKGKLKCEVCNKYFASKRNLRQHSLKHGDPSLLFRCEICPCAYTTPYQLNHHMQGHTNERKFICEVCGTAFKVFKHLQLHLRYHDEKQRKWQCTICEKKFFKVSCLKSHEMTHTDMKEFICQVCGRGFNHPGNLKGHLKLHEKKGDSIKRDGKSKKSST